MLLDFPDWEQDSSCLPHRQYSQFHSVADHRWHVQRGFAGPRLLMLHGTGASVHSFGALMQILGSQFEILTVDLPNHGFTRSPKYRAVSLRRLGGDVEVLLRALDFRPDIIIGHSAGAAIAVQLGLGSVAPCHIVSINGALRPFAGAAGFLFPLMAKGLFYNPLSAHLFAFSARDRRRVERLIESTGSHIPADTLDFYAMLLSHSGHISGALGLMADWDLSGLEKLLGTLPCPVTFIAGAKDKAVPPGDASRLCAAVPKGEHILLEQAGHLAHEENPEDIAAIVLQIARQSRLMDGAPETAST